MTFGSDCFLLAGFSCEFNNLAYSLLDKGFLDGEEEDGFDYLSYVSLLYWLYFSSSEG